MEEQGSRAPTSDPRVVLVTAPDEQVARTLARLLVERRVAACVNLLPGITSVYRWEGSVAEEGEILLVVKTAADRVDELERLLADHHPYDVPECVALAPSFVEERYLRWLRAETRPPAS